MTFPKSIAKPNYLELTLWEILHKDFVLDDIDFQRFAAEDEGRTEEPTERRKREEREKGNIPRTNEIPSALILLGTTFVLFLLSTYFVHQISELFRVSFQKISEIQNFDVEDAREFLWGFFWNAGKIVFPMVLASFLLGIVGNVVQVGFLFTLRPLEFQFQRIFPDFRRILPTRRNLIGLLKTIAQVLLVILITYIIIQDDLIPMLKSSNTDLQKAISIFGIVTLKVLIITGIFLLIIAILDYFYQRYEYIESLKMTISEVRQEIKEEIGDPLIRKRQRERALEILKDRASLRKVKEADVVITNPTHYAVALQYNYPLDHAPKVIAKGKDSIALLMKVVARENNIPIEENPPLARELYHRVEIGQEIPQEFYRAVVLIYQKLEKFRKLIGK
ncbi:MAG: EscU/YscU/HrcU family type III secretion system export apparatus switch protein [Leptospiraceae bacterium]|nr:EscU/YscU/HrcU family type III secretion system export apparatus switch protein [Leptospiraceae bacterium]MDW7976492.1 EscU/YscU/HrcU family type III secretion system export apparatus switch protein [Leptospiraceae bacterium]